VVTEPSTAAERFAVDLRALHTAAGSPEYRKIVSQAARQDRPVKLTDSSLSDWLGGKSVPTNPRTLRFLVEFLEPQAAKRAGYQRRGVPWWEDMRQQAQREKRPAGAGVQARTVGEAHRHVPQEAGQWLGDEPIIASVERKPEALLAPTTVVVDDEPPREMATEGSLYSILVEARTTWAVTLRGMRAVVVDRRSPRRACIEPPRIAGILESRPFTADFDAHPPRLTALEANFPFTVSATDVEMFEIRPRVSSHEVSWFLEVDWTCQKRSGTTIVDDDGRPFETYPAGGPRTCPSIPSDGHVPGCPTERLVALRRAGAIPDTGLAKAELEAEFPDWAVWRSDAGTWYATYRWPGRGGTVRSESPNGLRMLLRKRHGSRGTA
jgi:hypothetical protein